MLKWAAKASAGAPIWHTQARRPRVSSDRTHNTCCQSLLCDAASCWCWPAESHPPASPPPATLRPPQVLQSLSAKGIAQRLDKRRLQHELDTHRLFLLTSYHRQQGGWRGAGGRAGWVALRSKPCIL